MEAEEWDISLCGLNYAKCDRYQSSECGKCRGLLEAHWSPDCRLVSCAREKGHQCCFECSEFPRKGLQEFASDGYAHDKQTVENMKRMKEIGGEAWIVEQGKSAFCPGWRSKEEN